MTKRAKYLRDASGKRSAVECYTQMQDIAHRWMREIRMAVLEPDDLDQAMCDFTYAIYLAADRQDPSHLTKAFTDWQVEREAA